MKTSVFLPWELDEAAELGAVDDRSVRLWVRAPAVAGVDVSLQVEGRAPLYGVVQVSAATDWTGAITLRLPVAAPGHPFICTAGRRRLTGRLAPAAGTRSALSFGFGSCNLPFRAAPGGVRPAPGELIYPAMLARLQQARAELLLLVGDQIYSDVPASASIPAAFARPGATTTPEAMLAAYRQHYRAFFNAPGFRAMREQLPTYCIWDDHEIFDAWGAHLTPVPHQRRLYEAAARAYSEYQHARNPGADHEADPGSAPYNYSFTYGDIGFLVLDLRSERDYDRQRLLGASQWQAAHDFLARCTRDGISTLFVVASVPIAHVSRWTVLGLSWVHEEVAANLRDRWCSNAFIADRDQLLDLLFSWQTAAPRRQAIVLSGDVHAASAFTIQRRGAAGIVQQFNSSAFSHPLHGVDRLLNQVGVHFPNLFESRFRFRRRALVYHNNFGLVRLAPLPGGGHRVEFTVQAWLPQRRALRVAARITCLPLV